MNNVLFYLFFFNIENLLSTFSFFSQTIRFLLVIEICHQRFCLQKLLRVNKKFLHKMQKLIMTFFQSINQSHDIFVIKLMLLRENVMSKFLLELTISKNTSMIFTRFIVFWLLFIEIQMQLCTKVNILSFFSIWAQVHY